MPALVIPGCSGCICLVMQWKRNISGGWEECWNTSFEPMMPRILKHPVFDWCKSTLPWSAYDSPPSPQWAAAAKQPACIEALNKRFEIIQVQFAVTLLSVFGIVPRCYCFASNYPSSKNLKKTTGATTKQRHKETAKRHEAQSGTLERPNTERHSTDHKAPPNYYLHKTRLSQQDSP